MAQSSSEISFNPQPSLQPSTAPGVDAEPAPYTRPVARRRNYIWSELMKRVFLVDVLQCERCGGGRMKILAAIHPPDATGKILECLGLPSRAPPLAPVVSAFNFQMDSLVFLRAKKT